MNNHLEFKQTGKGVDLLLHLAGFFAWGMGVFVVFVTTRAGMTNEFIPLYLFLLVSGLLFLTWGRLRRRQFGHFQIDFDQKTIQQKMIGNKTVIHPFSEIKKIKTPRDWTDGMRIDLLPDLPRWLLITLKSGQKLHLAKGSLEELEPYMKSFRENGLLDQAPQ